MYILFFLPDGDSEQALASPQGAGRYEELPHRPALAAVHSHRHLLLYVRLGRRKIICQLLEKIFVLMKKYLCVV